MMQLIPHSAIIWNKKRTLTAAERHREYITGESFEPLVRELFSEIIRLALMCYCPRLRLQYISRFRMLRLQLERAVKVWCHAPVLNRSTFRNGTPALEGLGCWLTSLPLAVMPIGLEPVEYLRLRLDPSIRERAAMAWWSMMRLGIEQSFSMEYGSPVIVSLQMPKFDQEPIVTSFN